MPDRRDHVPDATRLIDVIAAGALGADLVINKVGLAELDPCLEAYRSGGRIAYIGAAPVSSDRQR